MQQSIVKFYCFCRTDTAQHVSGIIMSIIRSPSNCRCSPWFPYECGGGRVLSRGRFVSLLANRPRLRIRPPPHSYGNQKLQRQFYGLLMMGIIMPETCWAVSVRQNNKILRLIVASSWVFYLSDWRCTEPQTLNLLDWITLAFIKLVTSWIQFKIFTANVIKVIQLIIYIHTCICVSEHNWLSLEVHFGELRGTKT